jgi:hypothetical protein
MHWRKPVQELKEESDVECYPEPGMQKASHRPTSKEWCEPAEEPWRVNGKSGKQRKNEGDSDDPMKYPRVNRMA